MMDKITALAVPPGNSLTDPPGKWKWEQPPQFPNPDDAIDHALEMMSNGPARDDMLKLMLAGITVEEIVEQLAFKGFMAGAVTPDVAELMKPALGIALVDMALQAGFEPQMFVDPQVSEGEVEDATFFNIAKDRNPELYKAMNEKINEDTRMAAEEKASVRVVYPQAEAPASFLNVPEGEVE
jgi:hypothetical protein